MPNNDPYAKYQANIDPYAKYQQPDPKVLLLPKEAPKGINVNGTQIDPNDLTNPSSTSAIIKRLPENLPALGGIAGSFAGSPIFGAAAGSFAKQALSQDPSLLEASKDTLTNGIAPELAGKGISAAIASHSNDSGFLANLITQFPKLAESMPGKKIADTINAAKKYMFPQSGLLETMGENARAATQTVLGLEHPNLAAPEIKDLTNVPYQQTGISTQRIKPLAKSILSDVTSVRNAKLVDPQGTQQLALSDLITKNFSAANNNFNPTKILDTLGNDEVYKEAVSPKAYSTFKTLMETAQKQGIGKPIDSLLSWKEFRKVGALEIGNQALGMFGINIPPGIIGGLTLGSDAISHIASDPKLGQLVIDALKSSAKDPSSQIIGKAIANGLRGTSATLKLKNGEDQKVTFGADGRLQYAK